MVSGEVMMGVGFSTCQERWAVRFVYMYFQPHHKIKYSMFIAIAELKGQLFP